MRTVAAEDFRGQSRLPGLGKRWEEPKFAFRCQQKSAPKTNLDDDIFEFAECNSFFLTGAQGRVKTQPP
jgi:hypothetical protein